MLAVVALWQLLTGHHAACADGCSFSIICEWPSHAEDISRKHISLAHSFESYQLGNTWAPVGGLALRFAPLSLDEIRFQDLRKMEIEPATKRMSFRLRLSNVEHKVNSLSFRDQIDAD